MRRRLKVFLSSVLMGTFCLALVGCWDLLSWSPDGRYLAFVSIDDGELWLWDTRLDKPTRLSGQDAIHARFLRSGSLLYLQDDEDSDDDDMYRVVLRHSGGNVRTLPFRSHPHMYTVGPASDYVYSIGPDEDDTFTDLWRHSLRNLDEHALLFRDTSEIAYPAIDESGNRLLCVADVSGSHELILFDLTSDPIEKHTILNDPAHTLLFPTWIGDGIFTYYRTHEKDADPYSDLSQLVRYDLDSRTESVLFQNAVGFLTPKLTADKQQLVFTGSPPDRLDAFELDWASGYQLLSVHLDTLDVRVLTDDAFGAAYPAVNPRRNLVAYVSSMPVRILDLDTGKTTTIWRNEEERIFASAERFWETGEHALALASYQDILDRVPESSLGDLARYRLMEIYLGPPYNDVDAAMRQWRNLHEHDLSEQATSLIWRAEDLVATDPADDLISRYERPAEIPEEEFDPDRGLDLTTLHARWSSTRLYLRIGFRTRHDLDNFAFKDVLLLLDHSDRDEGVTQLGRGLSWDRPASYQVWIRRWYDAGSQSRYDIEIRNADDEVISAYKAEGFSSGHYPDVDVVGVFDEVNKGGAVALAISRNTLRLHADGEVNLQVASLIPEATPGVTSVGGSLADTYGAATGSKTGSATETTTIVEFAGVLRPPSFER